LSTQTQDLCQIAKIGVEINEMISIRDDKTHILETFEKLQNTVDLLYYRRFRAYKDDITKKHFVIILMMSSLLMKKWSAM
jgi:hypothetical protein